MKRQLEITDRTRQTFIDAFCELYRQKPLDKISVQEITRKTGYNRSTFYQYFLDINDLLLTIENEMMEYLISKRGEAGADGRSFLHDLVELYTEKELYPSALLGQYGSNRFLGRIKAIPGIGLPGFHLSDGNKLKPYLMEYHLSGVLSMFQMWLHRGHDLSIEKFISLVADLYQAGIAAFDAAKYGG